MKWQLMDLHIHTPASADYQEDNVAYIDILRTAELRGLDIIAFTDHNSVAGYAAMMQEIEQLRYLEQLGRAEINESRLLADYERLLGKILVLPGFEFTATFGFHILGIFSPDTPVRQLEHVLLSMNIPIDALDEGITEVGASVDVLTAYKTINEGGGICVAAHANSAHGVAMRGFDFGGQTKIAYTQDPNLHALEVTDLERKGRHTTQRFFDGTKPEYPRRMRCIQGSDAHRLTITSERDLGRGVNLGIGDRSTEVLLTECTFEALLDMFQSKDFARSRPYSSSHQPLDYVQVAREEGTSLVQSFHETMDEESGALDQIIADVCAFANTNGGIIYVGVSADPKQTVAGVENPQRASDSLSEALNDMITPPVEFEIDTQTTQGKTVIRVQVTRGTDLPYAIDDNKIYVRDETETSLAVRDEIVSLVRQGADIETPRADYSATARQMPATASASSSDGGMPPVSQLMETASNEDFLNSLPPGEDMPQSGPPRVGVEIVGVEQKRDTRYYIMRDLRNGNIVKNVTRSSARRLWHYAIIQHEGNPVDEERVQWQGDYGLWRVYRRAGGIRYDLVQRENGHLRIYYGVTDRGMHGAWQAFISPDDDDDED